MRRIINHCAIDWKTKQWQDFVNGSKVLYV